MLSVATTLQVVAGPAAGGLLAGLAGAPAAFAVNAASFGISALLLTRLGPLPPPSGHRAAPEPGSENWALLLRRARRARRARVPRRLLADTAEGLRYAARAPLVRALAAGTFVFVAFASMDNVALVFLVERALHGNGIEYGTLTAVFGAGMVAASLALARWAPRRRPRSGCAAE